MPPHHLDQTDAIANLMFAYSIATFCNRYDAYQLAAHAFLFQQFDLYLIPQFDLHLLLLINDEQSLPCIKTFKAS